MSQNKKTFNPEEIVDLNIDYYTVLGLEKGNLPEADTTAHKKEISKILEDCYRKSAKNAHPDFGGSPDAFKLVVRAHTILGDPILRKYYESGGKYKPMQAGDGNIEIDWTDFGDYRKGTSADTIGYALFLKICQKKDFYRVVPAFHPIDNFDNYEWDWAVPDVPSSDDRQFKLALSLVHDENDVLRLTSGEEIADSLPFKIYMCIPRASLYFLRGEEEKFVYEDGSCDILSGRLQAATYSDYNLLETTSSEAAIKYIEENLEADLNRLRDGTLIKEQAQRDTEAGQNTWVSPSKMKSIDTDVLKAIMRMKSYEMMKDTKYDETADELLDRIPSKKKKGKV